ncbi:hypothetical protein [Nocardia gipuzkoensis]
MLLKDSMGGAVMLRFGTFILVSISSAVVGVGLSAAPATAVTDDTYVDWFDCRPGGGHTAVATDGVEYCYGGIHNGKIVVYPA